MYLVALFLMYSFYLFLVNLLFLFLLIVEWQVVFKLRYDEVETIL